MHIFADSMTKVTLSNNNIRIVLNQNGPDKTQVEAGTLIVPVDQVQGFIAMLADSMKQIEEQVKAQK